MGNTPERNQPMHVAISAGKSAVVGLPLLLELENKACSEMIGTSGVIALTLGIHMYIGTL
jgi:hypothetical protein